MTFTKEQLLNQARENVKALKMAVVQNAFKDIRPAIELDLALAELALAGMEAEPVINRQSICNKVHDKCSRLPGATFYNAAEFALDEICTAPQPLTTSERAELENYRNAQQVVRSITQHFDDIALETAREIMCDVNRRHEFLGGEVQLLSRIQCRVDDACRAAMLQGKADGNSPVIPDGWVACSERMPNVGDVVLTAKDGFVNVGEMERSGANYRYFTSIASGRELPATHWQPLPAAPQQENE